MCTGDEIKDVCDLCFLCAIRFMLGKSSLSRPEYPDSIKVIGSPQIQRDRFYCPKVVPSFSNLLSEETGILLILTIHYILYYVYLNKNSKFRHTIE